MRFRVPSSLVLRRSPLREKKARSMRRAFSPSGFFRFFFPGPLAQAGNETGLWPSEYPMKVRALPSRATVMRLAALVCVLPLLAAAKSPALTEVKVFPADINLKTRQD